MSYTEMSFEQKVEVHIKEGRAQLLQDCRRIGISANKIKDIQVLATAYVKAADKIRQGA